MLWFLYNILFAVGFVIMLPRFLLRMKRRGGYASRFGERFGRYDAGTRAKLLEGGRVWIHAVSVGELFVALRFMRELRVRRPGIRFVVSTTTSTAHAIALKEVVDPDVLIYFPLDFPLITRRVLDAMKPSALFLTECELWPNLIRMTSKRGIPIVLINGRISEHSYKGYRRLRLFTRPLLALVDLLCMQSEADASRLIDLGAVPEKVRVIGSTKYDLEPVGSDGEKKAADALRQAGIGENALILLGGSTWSGEESALLDIYKTLKSEYPSLALVLVPRHAERREEVLAEIAARSLTVVCRTRMTGAQQELIPPDVLLVDTTGELRSFYACATVIFVGKSLADHGGQNIIEPAICGKPIVVGPHMENFPVITNDFLAAEALVQIRDSDELEKAIRRLLADPESRKAYGIRAAELVQKKRGAVMRSLELIQATLDAKAHSRIAARR